MEKFIIRPFLLSDLYYRITSEGKIIVKSRVLGHTRTTIYDMDELIDYINQSHTEKGFTYEVGFFMENYFEIIYNQIEEFHYYSMGLHLKSENIRLKSFIDSLTNRIELLQIKIFKLYTKNKNHGKSEK